LTAGTAASKTSGGDSWTSKTLILKAWEQTSRLLVPPAKSTVYSAQAGETPALPGMTSFLNPNFSCQEFLAQWEEALTVGTF